MNKDQLFLSFDLNHLDQQTPSLIIELLSINKWMAIKKSSTQTEAIQTTKYLHEECKVIPTLSWPLLDHPRIGKIHEIWSYLIKLEFIQFCTCVGRKEC